MAVRRRVDRQVRHSGQVYIDAKDFFDAVPEDEAEESGMVAAGGEAALQGRNDFKKTGYGGPCPASGSPRHCFRIYALNTGLGLGPGTTRLDLLRSIKGTSSPKAS